jgi:hypothetical protein
MEPELPDLPAVPQQLEHEFHKPIAVERVGPLTDVD